MFVHLHWALSSSDSPPTCFTSNFLKTKIYTVEKKACLLNFELEFKFNTQSLHEQYVFFFPVAFVFSTETVASSLSCWNR